MYDVITIGGAVRDLTFYVGNKKSFHGLVCFPYGKKIEMEESYFTDGGGACNVAVGLSKLGLKVAPLVRVGDDWAGQAIQSNFKKNKVDTTLVQIDKRVHTGASAIIHPTSGDRTALTYRGANKNLEIPAKLVAKLKTKWFFISSLSGNLKLLQKIFQVANKNKIKIAWNPGMAEIKNRQVKNFLKKTDILIVNQSEASILTGNNRKDKPSLLKKARSLGSQIVAITCGENGAYLVTKEEILYNKAKPTKVVDVTGAGDSFSAGLLAGWIFYKDLKKSLNLGLYSSAANLKIIGAQDGLLTKKDLKKLKL